MGLRTPRARSFPPREALLHRIRLPATARLRIGRRDPSTPRREPDCADPTPADESLRVNGRPGRHVRNVPRLLKRLEQLVRRHQDRRLELAERTARADSDRDARARHIVRRLDQGEAVALAERVPEALQLAARVLEDAADGLCAVFRAVDQLGPDLRLVAEGRHVEGHNPSLLRPRPVPAYGQSFRGTRPARQYERAANKGVTRAL